MSDIGSLDNLAFGTGTQRPVLGAAQVQLLPLTNFLGGINLARADSALFDNESGDLCNIDVLQSGGFCRRSPVRMHTRQDLPAQVCNIVQWQDEEGEAVLYMALEDGTVYSAPGGSPSTATPVLEPFTLASGNCESIEIGFNQYFFGPDGDAQCVEGGPPSAGGTVTALEWKTMDAQWAYDPGCEGRLIAVGCDDSGSPDLTDEKEFEFGFPRAKCMAIHSDFAWAANVTDPETGEVHCNRLYRSFPLTNEALTGQVWGSSDYIDIDQGDGDCITNLVSCGPNLYVFKHNSVYVISGTTESTGAQIASVKLCGDAGTPSCKTAACCGCVLYFWDASRGLYRITEGGAVEHVFGKLENLIRKGCIRPNCEPSVGCCNGRIYVSVPEFPVTPEDEQEVSELPDECTNTTTYVLDTLTDSGTWTKYTYGLDCYLSWRPRGDRPRCLAASSVGGHFSVVELERPGFEGELDQFSVGGGVTEIEGYWRSKWFTGTNPFVLKNWCAPNILVESTDTDVEIDFTYLRDWRIDQPLGGGSVPFFEEFSEDYEEPIPLREKITPDSPATLVCPPAIQVSDSTCPISNRRKESRCGPRINESSYAMQVVVAGPTDKPWCVCAVMLAFTQEEYACG